MHNTTDTNPTFLEKRAIQAAEEGKNLQDKEEAFRHNWKYLLAGIGFGLILVKSEIISWLRMQEMFRLQSIYMYGLMGSAIAVGATSVWMIKKFNLKTLAGEPVQFPKKTFHKGQVIGGLLFGFGWALTGACPGPLYAQIGAGFLVSIITLISAIAGTWVYGWLKDHLPH